MPQHFYNTVNEVNGQLLQWYDEKGISLENFILKILVKGKEYTCYDVLEKCLALNFKTKENSVRRAIHYLVNCEEPKVELTGNRVVNKFYSPVPNHTIRLIELKQIA